MPDIKKWKFEFQPEHDGSLSLESAVGQAIGAASVCWSDMSGTGVFQDDRAREIANKLIDFIKENNNA